MVITYSDSAENIRPTANYHIAFALLCNVPVQLAKFMITQLRGLCLLSAIFSFHFISFFSFFPSFCFLFFLYVPSQSV